MKDNLHPQRAPDVGSALISFAIGVAVGAGIALLLAPDSGARTRQRLASTARRWGKNAEHALDQARESVADLGTDAKAALKAGQSAFLHDRATRESTHSGA